MVRVPLYDDRTGSGGVVPYPSPATGAFRQAQSFERIQQGLAAWYSRAEEEAQYQATQRVQAHAAAAQAEVGGERLLQPEGLPARYARVFQERAEQVYTQEVEREAQRTAFELRQAHGRDPEAFAAAWESYVKGQEAGLRKSDPSAAVRVRQYLDAYGDGQYQRLAEAAYARERAVESQQAKNAFSLQLAEHSDALRASGDEEDYYERLQQAQNSLAEMLELGTLSPEEWRASHENAEASLAKEMLYGKFRQRLAAGDLGAAEAVIGSLREGKWFRNNLDGEALANTFAAELRAMLSGSETRYREEASAALRKVKQAIGAAVHTGEGSWEDVRTALDFVREHGTATQRDQADELEQTIPLVQSVGGGILELPLPSLDTLADLLTTSTARLGLDDTTRSTLENMVNAQRESILEGISNNDYIPTHLAFEDRLSVTPEIAAERRAKASQLTGIPENLVPVWSNEDRTWFSGQLNSALRSQQPDALDELISSYMRPFGGDLRSGIRAAVELHSELGLMYLPAVLHAMGEGGDLTTDLLYRVSVGRNADRGAVFTASGATASDVRMDRRLAQQVRAAAMGDPNVADSIYQTLTDAYVGLLLDETVSPTNALAEVRRLMAPFQRPVELSSGQTLPRTLLASFPDGVDVVVAEINQYLRDPRRLRLEASAAADIQAYVAVQPAPGGGLGFRNLATGRFLTDENNQPITVMQEDVISAAGLQPDETPGWFERALQWGRSVRDTYRAAGVPAQAARAAKRFGTDAGTLEAIFHASMQTPPEDLEWRFPQYALPSNVERTADWREIAVPLEKDTYQTAGGAPGGFLGALAVEAGERAATARVVSAGNAPYLAAQRLRDMERKFPQDRRAQLAAYWQTPELVAALQREHGDEWFRELPMSAQEFVGRVQRRVRGGDDE